MDCFVTKSFVVGALNLLSFGPAALGETAVSEPKEPGLRITAGVYNHARVPSPTLARAEKEATRVFHNAGVQTVWLDLTHCLGEQTKDAACHGRRDPTRMFLKILPRSMTKRLSFTRTTFGIAVPPYVAMIFHHRVEGLADRGGADAAVVLGHVMAHEMAHLLLGPTHSSHGIMRARWRRKELQRAARGNLVFTPQQAARIRAALLTRLGTE